MKSVNLHRRYRKFNVCIVAEVSARMGTIRNYNAASVKTGTIFLTGNISRSLLSLHNTVMFTYIFYLLNIVYDVRRYIGL